MFLPVKAYSLGLFRLFAGIVLTIDLFQERAFLTLVEHYDKDKCFFKIHPYLPVLTDGNLSLFLSVVVVAHIGMTLGISYRLSSAISAFGRWYLIAIDMSRWNNHTYFFALLCTIFAVTDYDAQFSFGVRRKYVPQWQLWIIQYQQFIIYFMAAIQKILSGTWLLGKSAFRYNAMAILPFINTLQYVLNEEQIVILMHWCGVLLELGVVGLWYSKTRIFTMVVLTTFHTMNFHMFDIGMFPVMCIGALTVFLNPSWCEFLAPRQQNVVYRVSRSKLIKNILITYAASQLLLPFSHKILVGTQGYNGYGLYGYSWKMFIIGENKRSVDFMLRVEDDYYEVEPRDFMNYFARRKWVYHPVLVKQFAMCVYEKLELYELPMNTTTTHLSVSGELSAWGKPVQSVYNPEVNLFFTPFNMFERSEFVMPLE